MGEARPLCRATGQAGHGEAIGIHVQEGLALGHLLAGRFERARAVVARLSEGQLEALTDAALELSELAGSEFDRRLDVRPLKDPEAGLAEILDREGVPSPAEDVANV